MSRTTAPVARENSLRLLLNKDPAAFVDRWLQLVNRIHEKEEKMTACRREFITAGRMDIARKMLYTPWELKELAGFLWYGQPIVITEETMMPSLELVKCIRSHRINHGKCAPHVKQILTPFVVLWSDLDLIFGSLTLILLGKRSRRESNPHFRQLRVETIARRGDAQRLGLFENGLASERSSPI